MEEMKVDQTSRLQSLIQQHQYLDRELYQNYLQEQAQQQQIMQQDQKLFELRVKKLLRLYELEQGKELMNLEGREKELDQMYKEKLQNLLSLINSNENESIQLVSITKSQLTVNYYIYMPNKQKSVKLLELELIIDTQTFKIKNVLNKHTNQYLTQNELSLTLYNLTQNYNFGSKSIFFVQNFQKAIII